MQGAIAEILQRRSLAAQVAGSSAAAGTAERNKATELLAQPEHFNAIYLPQFDDMARTQIDYGGAGSGKSVWKAQQAVIDVLSGGRNYLICRAVGRTIRRSVFAQVRRAIADLGVNDFFTVNKSEFIITCSNGYQILFSGLDDVEKLKSITPDKGAVTDIWIEESTETERATIKELYKRQRGGDEATPKRLCMTFNPILQSNWIYKEYFEKLAWADDQQEYHSDELSILKTTYKDNRFLTTEDARDLEGEQDKYYRDVYTLGLWGVLGNAIFTNWRVEDLSGLRKQFTNIHNGLDFGFSSDPAAASRTHYDQAHKTIYIFDELYETGLTNDVLADRIKTMFGQEYIICDSAEPKSISELRRYGVNALAASKGKDSVVFGIQWLQQQSIVIDKQCVNTRNEFQQYKWKEDAGGNALKIPVDKHNHIIDELRYAYESESGHTETSWDGIDELGKVEGYESRWK